MLFQLFRIKVFFGDQMSLFNDSAPFKFGDAPGALKEMLLELAGAGKLHAQEDLPWMVGDFEVISKSGDAFFFNIGRNNSQIKAIYSDGRFVDEEQNCALYTHVFLDSSLEICAIAVKKLLLERA